MTDHELHRRLAGFYFCYFAAVGIFLPYWSPYLQHLGYTPDQIGELLALTLITKLVAPYLWGWLADRSGRRMLVVRIACLATVINFVLVFFAREAYLSLALALLFYSFFWNAALPQFEATTLNHLGDKTHRYSRIRLWGSIGFILTTVAMGFLLEVISIIWLPFLITGLFLALLINSSLIPEAPIRNEVLEAPTVSILTILKQPSVIIFFLVSLLMAASHGPYYAFFTIHLNELGYTGGLIGFLWALGVIAEVIIFLLVPRWLPRFGVQWLLQVTLLVTALRWLLTALYAESLGILLFAQCLHGFSFGLYHALAITIVHQFFTGTLQGRGQALLSSFGFGVGGALGNLIAGYLWAGTSPMISYLWAYSLVVMAFVISWGLRMPAD